MEEAFGASREVAVGFGDDVSALKMANHQLAILKTDMLVGSTDIPPGMTLKQAARKVVVANVSDFAAKGVRPSAGIVAVGLPANLTKSDVQAIANGLSSGATEYHFPFVGGDTNESKDLVISVALFGFAKAGRIVLRSGASVGDIVAVTGDFGTTAAGLKAILGRRIRPDKLPRSLAQSVYRPTAELDLGLKLASTGGVTASIDSSDGLAWSLHQLSEMSDVGVRLDRVPISKAARQFASQYGYDALDLALYGGEEYHLVVSVKSSRFRNAQKAAGGRLKAIGVITKRSEGIRLASGGRVVGIRMKGWEHFRRWFAR
jgi:thiamine-monophosphate kinase